VRRLCGLQAAGRSGARGRRGDAYCWAHVRRRFYDIAKNGPAPIADEALQRIAALYAIEDKIRGRGPGARRAVRQAESRPLVDALRRSAGTMSPELGMAAFSSSARASRRSSGGAASLKATERAVSVMMKAQRHDHTRFSRSVRTDSRSSVAANQNNARHRPFAPVVIEVAAHSGSSASPGYSVPTCTNRSGQRAGCAWQGCIFGRKSTKRLRVRCGEKPI
jgi:hypothetical protein